MARIDDVMKDWSEEDDKLLDFLAEALKKSEQRTHVINSDKLKEFKVLLDQVRALIAGTDVELSTSLFEVSKSLGSIKLKGKHIYFGGEKARAFADTLKIASSFDVGLNSNGEVELEFAVQNMATPISEEGSNEVL